jgi:hypothetical protein
MSYPSSLDNFSTKVDSVDDVLAAHMNAVQTAIVAIETELGTVPKSILDTVTPASSPTDVAAYLDMLANIVKVMTNAANWYSAAVRVLVRSNNLSDLASAATARTNLGLGSTDFVTHQGIAIPNTSTLTIASGVITLTGGNHQVDTEAAAATDDLDTINGLVAGQFVILRTVSGTRDVVIKHNTGNIRVNGQADKTLNNTVDVFIGFAISTSNVIGDVWDAAS